MPEPASGRICRPGGDVLVVGVVRNCSPHLRGDVERLRSALKSFANVRWLMIESDSEDDSVAILAQLAGEVPSFRFISLGRLQERMPLRTQRIAHCRNVYIEEIKQDPEYAECAYVIVSDFDGVNTLIGEREILSCWQRQDWDVCTANQRGPYYDIWALRHDDWCPNDCWRQRRFLRRFDGDDDATLRAAVYAKMITIPPDEDWIEVDSAFGGLAIYRRQAIIQGRYVGVTRSGEQTCEHVAFHQDLKRNDCRIFINPKLINAAYTDHTKHLQAEQHRRPKAAELAMQLAGELLRMAGMLPRAERRDAQQRRRKAGKV